MKKTTRLMALCASTTLGMTALPALADQQILDDLIVDGSLCVGFDCVNGESFGFDTIRMKENNLRIKAQDTSSTASFPTVDWQITFNETSNGGINKFSIDDIDNSRTPFTIEASAPSHSLYVDDGGRLGFGTSTPVAELHVKDGDTPTLRLEQDGSSGFTAQTWDMASNETNFFIRDATNGSTLPFRIRPGAPTSSIDVAGAGATAGYVGIGTSSPGAPLEVRRSESFVFLRLSAVGGTNPNDSADITYTSGPANTGELRYNIVDGDGQEMSLDANGNMIIAGELTTAGTTCGGGGCDLLFAEPERIMPLKDHMELMWEKNHLPSVGPTVENAPFNMTDKVGRMLNALEHAHIYIDQLHGEIAELREMEGEMSAMRAQMAEMRGLEGEMSTLRARIAELETAAN